MTLPPIHSPLPDVYTDGSPRQPIYHNVEISVPDDEQCNYFCKLSTRSKYHMPVSLAGLTKNVRALFLYTPQTLNTYLSIYHTHAHAHAHMHTHTTHTHNTHTHTHRPHLLPTNHPQPAHHGRHTFSSEYNQPVHH